MKDNLLPSQRIEELAEIICDMDYMNLQPNEIAEKLISHFPAKESEKLRLDESQLIKFIEDFYNKNWAEDLRTKKLAIGICSKFGVPELPSEEEIVNVITHREYLLPDGKSRMYLWPKLNIKQAINLAKAILTMLNGGKND